MGVMAVSSLSDETAITPIKKVAKGRQSSQSIMRNTKNLT